VATVAYYKLVARDGGADGGNYATRALADKRQREFTNRYGRRFTIRRMTGSRRRKAEVLESGEDEEIIASRGYYSTGIRNREAAKRDIRRKYRGTRPDSPVSRPGARFYVTARSGGRTAYLLGPYGSHLAALDNVERGRRLMYERYPHEASFVAVGTASTPEKITTLFGRGEGQSRRRSHQGRTSDRSARRRGIR